MVQWTIFSLPLEIKEGFFSCVIAKMIAIGLHTHELSKLMGCVKVKRYISACSKV